MQFRGPVETKSAVFQQRQCDFGMRCKWSKMGCRSIVNRKSGCGCSAGAISADPGSTKWLWLQRGAFFGPKMAPKSDPGCTPLYIPDHPRSSSPHHQVTSIGFGRLSHWDLIVKRQKNFANFLPTFCQLFAKFLSAIGSRL